MGIFLREAALHFCLPFQSGSNLKGKNLLQEEQILSFKGRLFKTGKRKAQKLFPFVKMAERVDFSIRVISLGGVCIQL